MDFLTVYESSNVEFVALKWGKPFQVNPVIFIFFLAELSDIRNCIKTMMYVMMTDTVEVTFERFTVKNPLALTEIGSDETNSLSLINCIQTG